MTRTTWRDEWPPFRLALVDETARCVANQAPADIGSDQPNWDGLTRRQQITLTENMAVIFMAQDRAMHNLAERGLPF